MLKYEPAVTTLLSSIRSKLGFEAASEIFYVGKRGNNDNNVDDGDDDDNNDNNHDNDDDDDDDGDGCWETEVVKLGVGNSKTMLSFPVR